LASASSPNPQGVKQPKPHLEPKDIKYLALEGGGGKGFAYLGAFQMLEKNQSNVNILQQIQGVAGTSVGAITALLVSLGMSAADIQKEMEHPSGLADFNDFFDPATPRLIPKPIVNTGDFYDTRSDNALETAYLTGLSATKPDEMLKLANKLQELEPPLVKDFFRGWLLNLGPLGILQWLSETSGGLTRIDDRVSKLLPPLSNIVSDARYFTYWLRDMGFFCGLTARMYFDNLIANRCVGLFGGKKTQYKNLTFEQHHKLFCPDNAKKRAGKDLLVCGANFSTGKSVLFSHRPCHTPAFPVADAVRISMSLPFAYKPYVFTRPVKGWPPCGTYIDGGLWNNLPFREVDPTKQTKNTLALRLEIDEPKSIDNLFGIMGVMLSGFFGSGESQVLREFEKLTIVLDIRDLSLFKFEPDAKTKITVTKRSRRTVSDYFGWQISTADRDKEDEEKTAKLLKMSACDKLAQ